MSHTHSIDFKTAFSVEELPDSQVKISGELPYAEVESERQAAIVALGKDVELDGFRKGHVPTPILEKHLGEMRILAEMAERAIAHAYPHILHAHEIDAIGQPEIEVQKIAPDNPLAFTATVAVIPHFTLPDYQKIAAAKNQDRPADEITDEELEAKITEIQKQRAAYEKLQQKAADSEDGSRADTENDLPTPESEATKQAEEALPELTDEYVKGLGQPGQFESVDDFKTKLREHLTIEKQRENAAKHRAAITDAIIAETTIQLPAVLVESELNQMFAQMQEDLDRAELKMEDYLDHIKKTREDLANEWRPAAEQRAKLQLILNEIAKEEEISPDPEEVKTQTAQLMERFKDADEHRVRLYVASVLTNEAVMKQLETAS